MNSSQEEWYRISELEALSGVPRRTIHFYLQQGLLRPPRKTGKTMAYYGREHLETLAAILKAKAEGMPLVVIRERVRGVAPEGAAAAEGGAEETQGGARRKSRVPNKTREDILAVGKRLFRKNGYRGTRVNDITKEINVGKGTFYFYFSDKKELFLECVPRIFAELFSQGWEEIAKEKDPLRRLSMRAGLVLPVLGEFASILSLCREAMEDPDPKLKAMGREVFGSIRRPLEMEITKGVERGIFRPVDPRIFATMMIGVMESLCYLESHDQCLDADKVNKGVSDLFSLALSRTAHDGSGTGRFAV